MNYANLKLDEILLQRIKNLVDKNEVEAKDVKQEASEILPFDTWLYVNWVFDAEHSNDKVAGGRGAQLHFGYDEDAFLSHSNKLYEAARTNTQLRTNFIESLRNNDIKALRLCEEVQTYHEFDRFSFCSRCNQCGGRGEVSCYRCSGVGHNHCYSCGGSGFVRCIEISPSNVSNIVNKCCGVCFGTGRSTCLTCSGRGEITCSSCGGNGFFTHYRKIYAQASPSYRFVTDSAKFNSELEAFLNANLPSFLAEKMSFEFVGKKTVAENKEYFCYRAQSILTRLDFSILGKIYCCVAFSNPPFVFIKPPVFDDIFADELELLKDAAKDNKITHREAFGIFRKFQGQPVLDKSMIDIARLRSECDEDTSHIVFNACDGFITKNTAKIFANLINKCLDKISPAYCDWLWSLVTFLFFIFSFLGAGKVFERHSNKYYDTALGFFISWLVVIVGVYPFSVLFTYFKRLKIPQVYRQKMRHGEPIARLLRFGLLACFIGAVYGGLATKGVTVSLFDVREKMGEYVENFSKGFHIKLCGQLEEANLKSDFCPVATKADKLNEQIKSISKEEKIKFIQAKLKANGYNIKVDGKMRRQTIVAASKFLNLPADKISDLDELYQKFNE